MDRVDANAALPTPPTERERAIHAVVLGTVLGLALFVLGRAHRDPHDGRT